MTGKTNRADMPHSRGVSRRAFLKIAAAGLLAGCNPAEQPVAAPVLSEAEGPTTVPTATPVPTDTSVPTITPMPTVEARRPDVIKMHPDVPSKVVHTHHAGVWDGDALVPNALRQMLDASITELTGLNDAAEAWAALFAPDERIAIKVNTIIGSDFWTQVPAMTAVTECLQEAGVPAERIVIFDRYTGELMNAGYTINQDGPGVRCYATEENYSSGWSIMDTDVKLSDVLLSCHALINMPILKQHSISGISFAMKNHYGTFDRPGRFHGQRASRAIPELNALPPIKDRTRLIIGDAMAIVKAGWHSAWTGDSILMSFDPVAHDSLGLQIFTETIEADGGSSASARFQASLWLQNAAELGLGTNDPDNMESAEVTMG